MRINNKIAILALALTSMGATAATQSDAAEELGAAKTKMYDVLVTVDVHGVSTDYHFSAPLGSNTPLEALVIHNNGCGIHPHDFETGTVLDFGIHRYGHGEVGVGYRVEYSELESSGDAKVEGERACINWPTVKSYSVSSSSTAMKGVTSMGDDFKVSYTVTAR